MPRAPTGRPSRWPQGQLRFLIAAPREARHGGGLEVSDAFLAQIAESTADSLALANAILEKHHYLGSINRGFVFADDHGVMVFANPSSRRLPHRSWIELVRWCIVSDVKNAGSKQWSAARSWLLRKYPEITTVVSYSDPSNGHTGALYRACNWLWAPTWHRLRPPPTGNGNWGGQLRAQAVKDRWIAVLREDAERERLLALRDASLKRRFPYAEYREPVFKRGRIIGGGGDFKKWKTGK